MGWMESVPFVPARHEGLRRCDRGARCRADEAETGRTPLLRRQPVEVERHRRHPEAARLHWVSGVAVAARHHRRPTAASVRQGREDRPGRRESHLREEVRLVRHLLAADADRDLVAHRAELGPARSPRLRSLESSRSIRD
jgi:hypothetical protein